MRSGKRRVCAAEQWPIFASRLRSHLRGFAVRCSCPTLLLAALAGCQPTHSADARARVTPADPKLATPDYWWNQPATVHVADADFVKLWNACEAETHARFMLVDREEYRLGLLTTLPLVSKQAFEPWRTDAVTVHDVAESTLAAVRRTVRFEISPRPDGTYEMSPKVLVERFASAERRLTAISQYHQAFSGPRAFADSPDLSGDAEVENGAAADYWYPLRRDAFLEQDLAAAITRRLRS
jgi:hypothetical protein